jgi:hypothetical protein
VAPLTDAAKVIPGPEQKLLTLLIVTGGALMMLTVRLSEPPQVVTVTTEVEDAGGSAPCHCTFIVFVPCPVVMVPRELLNVQL